MNRILAFILVVALVIPFAFAERVNKGEFSSIVPVGYTDVDSGDPDFKIYLEGPSDNGYIPLINITEYEKMKDYRTAHQFSDFLIREMPGIVDNWKYVSRRNVTNKYDVTAVNILSVSKQNGEDLRHILYVIEAESKIFMVTCTNLRSNGDSQDKACFLFFKSFQIH